MRTKAAKKPKTSSQTSKERVVAYIDPQIARRLKREKAETDKSLSLIVEEALSKRLKDRPSLAMTS